MDAGSGPAQNAVIEVTLKTMLSIAENGHEQPFEQIGICSECASFVKLIACIENPAVIAKILAHLNDQTDEISWRPG
jgi:hypothetical protein